MKEPQPEFSRAYRGYFLTLTAVISAFAVIDRIALLTVGQAIKEDLRISDFEFGLVSGLAFAAVYILVGLPLARIADTGNRIRLIAWSIAIWSAIATLSGLARSFVQLMLCRIVIGIVGMAWAVVTFLVLPILVFENVGVGDAIKRSAAMLRRTWCENLIVNMGIGLISFLLVIPAFVLLAAGAATGTALGFGTTVVLAVIWLIAVSCWSSAMSAVFQVAL